MGRAPPIGPPGASCGLWRPSGQRSRTSPEPRFQNLSIAGWDCVPAFWDRKSAGERAGGHLWGIGRALEHPPRFRGKSRDTRMLVWAPRPAARPTRCEARVPSAPPATSPTPLFARSPLGAPPAAGPPATSPPATSPAPTPASLATPPTFPRQIPGHRHARMGAPDQPPDALNRPPALCPPAVRPARRQPAPSPAANPLHRPPPTPPTPARPATRPPPGRPALHRRPPAPLHPSARAAPAFQTGGPLPRPVPIRSPCLPSPSRHLHRLGHLGPEPLGIDLRVERGHALGDQLVQLLDEGGKLLP